MTARPGLIVPEFSLAFAGALCAASVPAAAQNLLLNGDFENTAPGCHFNLSNSMFTAAMANATGFGSSAEICIMAEAAGCGYGLPPHSGISKLGIAADPNGDTDAFSLELSAPVQAGSSYSLSFHAAAHFASFSPDLGTVEVGLSNDPASFGTLVFSGTPTADGAWTRLGTTFVAPFPAAHLTVQKATGTDSWTHVDGFRLEGSCATVNYCVTSPNSVGAGAVMASVGSLSLAANTFVLQVMGAVPNQNGIFYYGPEQAQVPFGNGVACVGAGGIGVFRLPVVSIAGSGAVGHALDFTSPPASSGPGEITAGSTWYFQFWYRDPMGGMLTFNLSDGLTAIFCP